MGGGKSVCRSVPDVFCEAESGHGSSRKRAVYRYTESGASQHAYPIFAANKLSLIGARVLVVEMYQC